MLNFNCTTHQNSNSSLATLTQLSNALTDSISNNLKPSISAEEFLKSAPKVNISDTVSIASDVQSKSQTSYSLLPSFSDNAVITALKTLGLYKEPLGNGKHNITCLWVSEHSKSRDNGTVYFEGKGKNILGGFKCQHNHCRHRSTQDFIAFLEKAIAEFEASAK